MPLRAPYATGTRRQTSPSPLHGPAIPSPAAAAGGGGSAPGSTNNQQAKQQAQLQHGKPAGAGTRGPSAAGRGPNGGPHGANHPRQGGSGGADDGIGAAMLSNGRQSLSRGPSPEPVGRLSRDPLDVQNLLLRGSTLRKTEWVTGVVVFTGGYQIAAWSCVLHCFILVRCSAHCVAQSAAPIGFLAPAQMSPSCALGLVQVLTPKWSATCCRRHGRSRSWSVT